MGIYSWTLLIVVIVYGGLTVFAGATQLKQRKISTLSSFTMIVGGFLIILSSIKGTVLEYYTFYTLILGLLLIHFSAINNGFKLYGKINIKHHLIKLIISIFYNNYFFVKVIISDLFIYNVTPLTPLIKYVII